jgi:hypothetical protein
MEIGFDVIGDLFLSPDDEFDWDGKPTSLYCIVAGNVSNDMVTLHKTLDHLAENYKGIFYVSGSYEFENCDDIRKRVNEINYICKQVPHVTSLWHHVIMLENIGILGCNGWLNEQIFENHPDKYTATELRFEDYIYLKSSLQKLQKHGDVKNIIAITNSVPAKELYFGEQPNYTENHIDLTTCLNVDTEHKVSDWVFGTYGKAVDYKTNGINYISNPYRGIKPYWPKRINKSI